MAPRLSSQNRAIARKRKLRKEKICDIYDLALPVVYSYFCFIKERGCITAPPLVLICVNNILGRIFIDPKRTVRTRTEYYLGSSLRKFITSTKIVHVAITYPTTVFYEVCTNVL